MTNKHDYIERCPDCGDYLTWRQKQNHKCIRSLSFSVKEIPILYCCETQDENGKVFVAHGLDGIMYRLIEKKLSDDSYHEGLNRRRVTRTRNKIQQHTYANLEGTKTMPQTLKHNQNVYSEFIKHKPLETRSQCRSDCDTGRHTSSYE